MSNHVQEYWRGRAERAAAYAQGCPLVQTPVELGNPCARSFELQASALDGTALVARVVHPVVEGPHPVVLMFHDANRGVRGWHHLTRFVALGYAVVALQNRAGVAGVLVPEPLAVGGGLGVAMRVPTCEEPAPTGRSLSAEVAEALEATYADALVLAHLVSRVPTLDATRLLTWGEGLGGGVALVLAALVGAQAACALNPLPAALDARNERCDVALIASGLACPVLMGTCMLDLQASPQAQDRIAAGLACVSRRTYPRYAHERVNAYEDEMLAFLCNLQQGS